MSLKYEYSYEEMKNEYNRICSYPGRFDASPNMNKIILTFQPHFYEIENNIYKYDCIARMKLLKNREKYLFKPARELNDKEILRGFKISGIHIGFSHFSPLWVKAFIEKYDIKSIYDPCGGWGQRLLGSNNLDLYIYNDLDKRTCDGIKNICETFNIKNTIIYNEDSNIFTPKEEYEAVFTCPPYFDLEKYNYENTSTELYSNYEDWLNVWWRETVKHSLKNVKLFAFVINNTYKEDMKKICLEEELELIEEIPLFKGKNHFQRSTTNSFKGEQIIVFKTKK